MKKHNFAMGGSTTAGPSSGIGSPSMGSKRPTSADALRYFRATGNKAGADEILKAAVGKAAKMPDDYSSAFSKSGTLSPQQSAQMAMLERQKAGPQIPAGAVKPASSGIVSSSKEALASMPEVSLVPTIPRGAPRISDADMRAFETMARSTPQPGPRMPVNAPLTSVDRGPPMVAPGGSTTPSPTMRTPVRPTAPMQMMKAGGKAKAYASGGSVKGAGIAQRGVRKCKMV